jgi:DNA repair ATPase RecN
MDDPKIRLDICSINKLRHEIRHVHELFNDVKSVLDCRIRSVTQGIENFKRNLNEYEKKLKEKGLKILEERGVIFTSLGAFINSANFGSVLCRPSSSYDVVFDIKGSLIKKCENLLRKEEDLMRDCEKFNSLKSFLSKYTLEFNNVYNRFCTYSNELNEVTNALNKKEAFERAYDFVR